MNLQQICDIEQIIMLKELQMHLEFVELYNNSHGTYFNNVNDIITAINEIKSKYINKSTQ